MVFSEFGFNRRGKGWEATTGDINGDQARGHLYHYDNTPFCFKNQKTGETITLWNYVQNMKGLTNQDYLSYMSENKE